MGAAKYPAWAGERPVIPDENISKTVTADVVVVGCGNAGVLAAAAAAYAGATVSVIEPQSEKKLFMYGLADIGTVNSKWALSRGAPRIDETEMLAEWQHRTQNRSDPRLIRQYIQHSGEMLDWLLGMMDPSHAEKAMIANFPAPESTYTGEVSGFRSWIGTCELRTWNKGVHEVIAKAEEHGARWYWKNRARVLEQDGAGVVRGVTAEDSDGRFTRFLAKKGVILATGDYGGNHDIYVTHYHEIVEQYESYGLDTSGLKAKMGRNGDGHLMAVWAGGSMEPGPYASIYPTAMPVMADDPVLAGWGSSFQGASFLRVNGEGERYCDEGIMGIYGIVHRSIRMGPGEYYAIFDSKWEKYLMAQCDEHFMPGKLGFGLERLRGTMETVAARGAKGTAVQGRPPRPGEPEQAPTPNIWSAESIDELADYICFTGERKAALVHTVERYNEMCRQGRDDDFAKDPRLLMSVDTPPYYAVKSVIERPDVGLVTLNGVVTNEHQAVLDKTYRPIPGLYATGNCGGGKFFMQYASVMAGVAIGTAMTHGMLVGRYLASQPDL